MKPHRFLALAGVLAFGLAAAACTSGGDVAAGTGSTTPGRSPSTGPTITPIESPSATASPTRPPLPAEPPPSSGPASLDCVNGWTTPADGSDGFATPLDVIRRTTGVRGPLVVADMRFFEGPESPPSDKGYLLNVQRWYVKLFAQRDYGFAGRFLVESREFGQGVAAVAPFGSSGFRSPDWVGFQYDSADAERHAYPGLPGLWSGIAYDFVRGGGGLEIAGLPPDVVGCLSGT